MNEAPLSTAVLRTLTRWRRVTAGDLLSLLTAEQQLRFREQVLTQLEAEGLITVDVVGDERVLAITESGERWLSQRGAP